VGEFFDDIGIALVEGYGLTECTTVAAVSRPGSNRLGTVGPAVPGGEVRIGADGEVLLRGPHVFRGYHGNAEATQAILDEEGWLRTGDVGSLDDAGRLAITDRKKDLIVTPSGKNVAPQRIEAMLRESPLVAQALVVGSGRPRIGALIEVDPEAVRHSGLTEEEVPARIAGAVAEVNRRLGVDERVRCHAVLPRPFDVEEGEVTPTLKLRRKACEEHFRDLIDAMYARA
jgi:long-chain acyl-CoA synthetase